MDNTPPTHDSGTMTSRRSFLRLGLAGAVVAGGAGAGYFGLPRASAIGPSDPAIAALERRRAATGVVVRRDLVASAARVDLGGRVVDTSGYAKSLPGPMIRLNAGDQLKVRLRNDLDDPTTIHWHGLALRNDMDGVPGVTMKQVPAGTDFEYSFVAPDPGTHWYHPHVGTQLDRGLYGPLIVDDPDEAGRYDVEEVLMLDDWTDGWGDRPAAILAGMRKRGMGGMDTEGADMKPSAQQPLGKDTGDVVYPAHLINGRLPSDPQTIQARPSQKARLRIINAAADTAYRFAVGGHELTVTHCDGYAVKRTVVDTLIIGMGERYDIEITAKDGAFPISAVPEGKDDPAALAILRTASGDTPTNPRAPAELRGRMLSYKALQPAESTRLPRKTVDRSLDLELQMRDGGRNWVLNGKTFDDREPLKVERNERVRLRMTNKSTMFHPMHLHGHTFALAGSGVRKDTVNVLPKQSLSIDFETDNPGQWLLHCHNLYHGELGMMTVVSYVE